MGLDYMKGSVEGLAMGFDMETWRQSALLVFLLVGIVLTAMMQSSSATIAIFLTALNSELITFPQAAVAVIGANVGTTITIGLGAIGGNIYKKRLALSHFLFNLLTAILAYALLTLIVIGFKAILVQTYNNVLALSLFHTVFNLIGVLLFLPFLKLLGRILRNAIPEKKLQLTKFVDETDNSVSEAALEAIRKEGRLLQVRSMAFNLRQLGMDDKLVFESAESRETLFATDLSMSDRYDRLKLSLSNIVQYSGKVQKNELTSEESRRLHEYLAACRQIA
jgi:phosphate:Na+ symporter